MPTSVGFCQHLRQLAQVLTEPVEGRLDELMVAARLQIDAG
jgi:hypothetical protein